MIAAMYLLWIIALRLNQNFSPKSPLSIITGGTQRQFSENHLFGIFEDDLRSCLPVSPRIFEHLKSGIIAHF